jgi:hypothetical protein
MREQAGRNLAEGMRLKILIYPAIQAYSNCQDSQNKTGLRVSNQLSEYCILPLCPRALAVLLENCRKPALQMMALAL